MEYKSFMAHYPVKWEISINMDYQMKLNRNKMSRLLIGILPTTRMSHLSPKFLLDRMSNIILEHDIHFATSYATTKVILVQNQLVV